MRYIPKVCARCGVEKDAGTEYHQFKGKPNGNICKVCKNLSIAKRNATRPESFLRAQKNYQQSEKGLARARIKAAEWRKNNPEKVKEITRKYEKKRTGSVLRKEQHDAWYSKPENHTRRRLAQRQQYRDNGGLEKAKIANEKAVKTGKWDARRAVAEATRRGFLVKEKCAEASSECLGRLEWHHHKGYELSNWLEVVCLCARHHRRTDATLRSLQVLER